MKGIEEPSTKHGVPPEGKDIDPQDGSPDSRPDAYIHLGPQDPGKSWKSISDRTTKLVKRRLNVNRGLADAEQRRDGKAPHLKEEFLARDERVSAEEQRHLRSLDGRLNQLVSQSLAGLRDSDAGDIDFAKQHLAAFKAHLRAHNKLNVESTQGPGAVVDNRRDAATKSSPQPNKRLKCPGLSPKPSTRLLQLKRKCHKLIEARNTLSRDLLEEAMRRDVSIESLQLEGRLLRRDEGLKTREAQHLEQTTRKYEDAKDCLGAFPTKDTIRHFNKAERLLGRFKTHLDKAHRRPFGETDGSALSDQSESAPSTYYVDTRGTSVPTQEGLRGEESQALPLLATRKLIVTKTWKLMKRRDKLDEQLLEAAQKETIDQPTYDLRDNILRLRDHLWKCEQKHLTHLSSKHRRARRRIAKYNRLIDIRDEYRLRRALTLFKAHLGPYWKFNEPDEQYLESSPEVDDADTKQLSRLESGSEPSGRKRKATSSDGKSVKRLQVDDLFHVSGRGDTASNSQPMDDEGKLEFSSRVPVEVRTPPSEETSEDRLRLGHLVAPHLDDATVVYDRPGAKGASECDYLMSGGILTVPLLMLMASSSPVRTAEVDISGAGDTVATARPKEEKFPKNRPSEESSLSPSFGIHCHDLPMNAQSSDSARAITRKSACSLPGNNKNCSGRPLGNQDSPTLKTSKAQRLIRMKQSTPLNKTQLTPKLMGLVHPTPVEGPRPPGSRSIRINGPVQLYNCLNPPNDAERPQGYSRGSSRTSSEKQASQSRPASPWIGRSTTPIPPPEIPRSHLLPENSGQTTLSAPPPVTTSVPLHLSPPGPMTDVSKKRKKKERKSLEKLSNGKKPTIVAAANLVELALSGSHSGLTDEDRKALESEAKRWRNMLNL
ncbi:hypothetical protein JX266_005218 [Neoarthrinium moseri]|nr:hypothetical protein JX266_005218 [Neoarthrinium moseri]